jgi:hypothetical protein
MKKFINFFLVATMVALCIGFSSCSDDEVDGAYGASIVGTWENDYGDYQDWGICFFYDNGTCVIDGANADYSYKNTTLTVTYRGGHLDGERSSATVTKLTETEMALEAQGVHEHFVRIED